LSSGNQRNGKGWRGVYSFVREGERSKRSANRLYGKECCHVGGDSRKTESMREVSIFFKGGGIKKRSRFTKGKKKGSHLFGYRQGEEKKRELEQGLYPRLTLPPVRTQREKFNLREMSMAREKSCRKGEKGLWKKPAHPSGKTSTSILFAKDAMLGKVATTGARSQITPLRRERASEGTSAKLPFASKKEGKYSEKQPRRLQRKVYKARRPSKKLVPLSQKKAETSKGVVAKLLENKKPSPKKIVGKKLSHRETLSSLLTQYVKDSPLDPKEKRN